jgi:CheY-like chemotaxis protein
MSQRKRVLVADDQGVNRKLTMLRLEHLGCDVDVVENGLQVIEAVNRAPYDLVLLDCHMPHMDGFRAAQWIRQQEGARRHTPIVAFTASFGTTDRQRCLAAGMDDFVVKPVEDAELMRVIGRWLPDLAPQGAPAIDRNAMIAIFLDDAPAHIDALREAVSKRDSAAIAREAHALKSGAGNVGAMRIYELCEKLESGLGDPGKVFAELETEFRSWRS